MIKNVNPRVVILFLTILASVAIAMGWVAYSTDRDMHSEFLIKARIVARSLDIELISSLSGSKEDLNSSHYKHIKMQLVRIRNAVSQCRFLYLMGQRPNGKVFFFMDSMPSDSEDYTPPGLVYEEVSDSYLQVFDSKQEAVVGPISDRWGTLVTALIPLKDPLSGKLVAILGMDVDASDWIRDIIGHCIIPFVIIFLIAVLIMLMATRKQSEEALQKSEEKYRYLIDKLDDIIWTVDLDLCTTYVSPSITKNLGFTPQERMAQDPADQMTKSSYENITKLLIKELNREQEAGVDPDRIVRIDIEYYHKNGSTLWFENIITRLRDQDGILYGFHGVSRDISKRKLAEKEKINTQKIAAEQKRLALVGQIAGKMAHDFNNILGIIMGNTELSLLDCKETETRKTLELIFEQTIRGKNLTRNLVAFAKDQEPKQEFFRISEKIDLVVNLMKKDLEGIELIREDKPGLSELLADPGMIEHTLVNLIQNSIHAVSMVAHPVIIIRTFCMEDNICFEIKDNGCGIPKEHLKNIYEPSFTLKGNKDVAGSYETSIKGTGYGMSNVKKYIEQHKGKISIESEFGSGTKVSISLPVIKKELTKEEKTEICKGKVYFEKYILLVEDEQTISDVQYRILTQDPCHHKVDTASNGQAAIDLFDRNEYDFVSLDYVLPGKTNGMDVYNHIRETNRTIPILFISGNIEFLESIKALKQKDANLDHLSKPCRNKDYVDIINKLLERISTGCYGTKFSHNQLN